MDNILKQLTESFDLLTAKIYNWLDTLVLSIPNLILVLIVIFIGFKLIKYAKKGITKLAQRSFSSNVGVQNLVINVGYVMLYILLGLIVLTILGLKGPITTVLASAGVAGLALGLALQDPLMNLFSGIIMSVKHVFKIGDFVESNGFLGEVREISLKTTVLRMLSGEEVNIPNKLVLQAPVKNFSTFGLRRVEILCGVSYAEDLERVKKVAMEAVIPLAIEENERIKRPVELIYTTFADSSINFQLRFWTYPEDVWQFLNAKSEAIIALKKAFDEHDITIPFPIRTLDFGIKGWVELGKILPIKE